MHVEPLCVTLSNNTHQQVYTTRSVHNENTNLTDIQDEPRFYQYIYSGTAVSAILLTVLKTIFYFIFGSLLFWLNILFVLSIFP